MRPSASARSTHVPSRRVAVVLSAVNLQRFLPGMRSFVEAGRDYWLVDIYRPWEDLERLLRRWRPIGLITEWIPPITEKLLALKMPTVLAPYDLADPGIATVDVDDAAIGRMGADYFLERVLPHLAFVGNRTPYSAQREAAFVERVEATGREVRTFLLDYGRPRQYIEHWPASTAELSVWLQALPKPCGLFVAHDPLARTVAETCREAGIGIPHEVAILGVNDDPLVCNMTNPHLSSIGIPWEKVGHEVGARMEAVLRNPRRRDWPPVLVSPSAAVTRFSSDRSSTQHPTLLRALAHIREGACHGVRVEDVARFAGVSRRTLERLFQDELGTSPREALIRQRLERAQELLRETDLSMPLVAERSGFSTGEVFAVNFRRQRGETPSAYRRRFRLD